MVHLVPGDQIERIVGMSRHRDRHYARAVSAEQTVYILHSQHCLDIGIDLRECPYSFALDRGIDATEWVMDTPALVKIWRGRLVPDRGYGVALREAVSDDH